MNKKTEDIINALRWRYAVKVFDTRKKMSEKDLRAILECGRLSPSSLGLEMWKFIVVENPDIRTKLRNAGSDQSKITDAQYLVVVAYRTDSLQNAAKERLERTAKAQNQTVEDLSSLASLIQKSLEQKEQNHSLESWIKSQSYIPLGAMITAASYLGIDNAPMEGFENDKVDEILSLRNKNLKSAYMLALGYRGDDPVARRPKTRRDFDEVVEFIK